MTNKIELTSPNARNRKLRSINNPEIWALLIPKFFKKQNTQFLSQSDRSVFIYNTDTECFSLVGRGTCSLSFTSVSCFAWTIFLNYLLTNSVSWKNLKHCLLYRLIVSNRNHLRAPARNASVFVLLLFLAHAALPHPLEHSSFISIRHLPSSIFILLFPCISSKRDTVSVCDDC